MFVQSYRNQYRSGLPAELLANVFSNIEMYAWHHPGMRLLTLKASGWYVVQDTAMRFALKYRMRHRSKNSLTSGRIQHQFEIAFNPGVRIKFRLTIVPDKKSSVVYEQLCIRGLPLMNRYVSNHIREIHRQIIKNYEASGRINQKALNGQY